MPSIDAIKFNPLFYDALSGEFQPQQDEKGRTHTLGRLALSVLSKGAPSVTNSIDRGVYCSNPSWAPTVAAYVEFDSSDNEVLEIRLKHIKYSINSLTVTKKVETFPHHPVLLWYSERESHAEELSLSDDLNQIQFDVVKSAQLFFDKAA